MAQTEGEGRKAADEPDVDNYEIDVCNVDTPPRRKE
jgi:hypothetical protein